MLWEIVLLTEYKFPKPSSFKVIVEEFVLSVNVKLFGFIAGRKQEFYRDQDPVNVRAAELISSLW